MTKDERIKHAKEWYEDVKARMALETTISIAKTKVYGPDDVVDRDDIPTVRNNITLLATDSVSCLFDKKLKGKTCILNYASYKYPGGYFLGGSSAQEEALCHESNLYPILLSFQDSYYTWNNKHLRSALYLNRALYTPDVVFEHDGKRMTADVLTCAAPNFRTAHKYYNVGAFFNNNAMMHRLEFIGDILEEQKVDNFITGAWGCGVFMQNPTFVCEATTKILGEQRNIPNIYYAIPDRNSANYQAFLKKLRESGSKKSTHYI